MSSNLPKIERTIVRVSTYELYNSGSLKGENIDLTMFADKECFIEHCYSIFGVDAELMYQDSEGSFAMCIEESSIPKELFDVFQMKDYDQQMVWLALSAMDNPNVEQAVDKHEDVRFIAADNEREFYELLGDELLEGVDLPPIINGYVDIERMGKDESDLNGWHYISQIGGVLLP